MYINRSLNSSRIFYPCYEYTKLRPSGIKTAAKKDITESGIIPFKWTLVKSLMESLRTSLLGGDTFSG